MADCPTLRECGEAPGVVGYAGISTAEQTLDLQLAALKFAGAAPDICRRCQRSKALSCPEHWPAWPEPRPPG